MDIYERIMIVIIKAPKFTCCLATWWIHSVWLTATGRTNFMNGESPVKHGIHTTSGYVIASLLDILSNNICGVRINNKVIILLTHIFQNWFKISLPFSGKFPDQPSRSLPSNVCQLIIGNLYSYASAFADLILSCL